MLPSILLTVLAFGARSISAAKGPGSCTPRDTKLFATQENTCPRIANLDPHLEHNPWMYEPHCLDTPEDSEGGRVTYCLYTRASSGHRREFSIVTTPELAETLPLEDLVNASKPREEETTINSTSALFEMRDTRGRGLGLFATREISAGEVIFTDSPVLITLRDALDYLPRTERQEMQWRGVFQLSPDVQKLLLKLATSRGGDQIDDILQTNSLGLSLGDKRGYLALMPQVARINHACRPNTYYRFDETTFIMELFALRDIKPGEELSYSYGYSEMTQETRHEFFKENWGFECTCPLCSAPSDLVSKSDEHLRQINQLEEKLGKEPRNHRKQLAIVAKLLRLFDEEGLIIPKAKYCEIASYAANQLGDEARALKYGKMAQTYWSILAGPKSWEVQRMEELLRDPKKHPSWRPLKPDTKES